MFNNNGTLVDCRAPPTYSGENMKTYEWILGWILGDVISKGVIQAKTLRSAKRHASIDSGANKWGKKWLFEPAAGHVKYDGDARSTAYGSHRLDDFKPVEKMGGFK